MEKFCGHALRHLAFKLANVIREVDKKLILAIFKKFCTQASIIVALFYALYLVLVTLKQFDKSTFRIIICL